MRARTPLLLVVLATFGLAGTACDADGDGSGPTPTPPLTLERFCGQYGQEVLRPLTGDFADAMQELTQTLPQLTPSDTEQIDELLDGIEQAVRPLVDELRTAADTLTHAEAGADVTQAAERLEQLPGLLRDAFATGTMDDRNLRLAIQDSLSALDRHCATATGGPAGSTP